MLKVLLILISIYTEQKVSCASSKQVQVATKKISSGAIHYEISSEEMPISFQTRYIVDRRVSPGRVLKKTLGASGKMKIEWKIAYQDNNILKKEKLSQELVKSPIDEIILISPQGYKLSRSNFKRGKVLSMMATAYDTSPRSNGGYRCTKLGTPLKYGIVAVDPRIIPLRSVVYVEGYGLAVAHDTGGAIKGKRIDLCYPTNSAARRFGRRKVQVHIMSSL